MDEAEAATWRWIDAFALAPSLQVRQRLQHGRPALGVALGFPRASASALTLFSQYMAFLLIVDDEFDDGPAGLDVGHCQAAIGALVRVFDCGTASGPPAAAFSDLWGRIREGRSRSWCEAFRSHVTAWLWSYYAEAVDRATGRVPQLAEFLVHRRNAVGMLPFLDLCEVASSADLPEYVRCLPAVAGMRRSAVDNMGLMNDVFSAGKRPVFRAEGAIER